MRMPGPALSGSTTTAAPTLRSAIRRAASLQRVAGPHRQHHARHPIPNLHRVPLGRLVTIDAMYISGMHRERARYDSLWSRAQTARRPGTGSSTRGAALGRVHHGLRHRLPAEVVLGRARQRLAGRGRAAARPSRASRSSRRARSSTARIPRSKVSSSRDLRRQRLAQDRRHLGEAGVPGADRQRAAGGGLGRHHPERLREHARHDHRLGRRQQPRRARRARAGR